MLHVTHRNQRRRVHFFPHHHAQLPAGRWCDGPPSTGGERPHLQVQPISTLRLPLALGSCPSRPIPFKLSPAVIVRPHAQSSSTGLVHMAISHITSPPYAPKPSRQSPPSQLLDALSSLLPPAIEPLCIASSAQGPASDRPRSYIRPHCPSMTPP